MARTRKPLASTFGRVRTGLALVGAALLAQLGALLSAPSPVVLAPAAALPTTPEVPEPVIGSAGAYASSEVRVPTDRGERSATLRVPIGTQPVPGVVLVAGSGPGPRSFLAATADAFARRGVAVLTYDKDLAGYSPFTRDYRALGRDASAAAALLRRQVGIDPARVGLWGISEGGWVAAAAAADDPAIGFVVMASAPTVTPGQQLEYGIARFLHEHRLGPVRRMTWLQLALGDPLFDYTGYQPPLERVSQPVLAVFGAEDASVPIPTAVGILESRLPNPPAITVLAGAGHDLTRSSRATDRATRWIQNPDRERRYEAPARQPVPVLAAPRVGGGVLALLRAAGVLQLVGVTILVGNAIRAYADRRQRPGRRR